jgi:hypothetical protein
MFRKAKVVALTGFLIAAFGFPLYSAVFYGMTYVRRQGWRTYGEAPTAFIINTVLSCIALFAIGFVLWIRDGKREQALRRLPPPLIEESHISRYEDQNTEGRKNAKNDRS